MFLLSDQRLLHLAATGRDSIQQQQPTALACANAAASIADAVDTLSTIDSTSSSNNSNSSSSSSSRFEFQTAWLTLRQELLQLQSFTHVACKVSELSYMVWLYAYYAVHM
jgi:hypothetical protein